MLLITFKTLPKVDSLSLSGRVKSNKIILKCLVLRIFRLSESRVYDSKSNLKSLEVFNNSSISRTSALLSSISRISTFLLFIIAHLLKIIMDIIKIKIFFYSFSLILNNIHFHINNYLIYHLKI